MSMHMEGPALTTTRTKKYKLTKVRRAQLKEDMFHYNKKRKRNGEVKITFDEYLDYRCGIVTKRKLPPSEQGELRSDYLQLPPHRQNEVKHPSKPMGDGIATKKDSTQYTGTLIKGIATMHKSNAIPIIDEKQAKEVSSMRRG